MDVTYLGHSSFLIKGKTAKLVTDPYDKEVGLKPPKVSADVVTVSHDHNDHNQAQLVSGVKKVINGPGEYEVQGISIIGIPTFHDDKKGELRGLNTVYIFEVDGLRIAHLGDLGHKLSEKHQEAVGDLDVLMIPVGGHYTIDSSLAAQIVRDIEPKIIIPMHFFAPGMNKKTFGELSGAEPFISEIGLPVENLDKLSIKISTIGEEQKVCVLKKK